MKKIDFILIISFIILIIISLAYLRVLQSDALLCIKEPIKYYEEITNSSCYLYCPNYYNPSNSVVLPYSPIVPISNLST